MVNVSFKGKVILFSSFSAYYKQQYYLSHLFSIQFANLCHANRRLLFIMYTNVSLFMGTFLWMFFVQVAAKKKLLRK